VGAAIFIDIGLEVAEPEVFFGDKEILLPNVVEDRGLAVPR
jgi:hypothetical protein